MKLSPVQYDGSHIRLFKKDGNDLYKNESFRDLLGYQNYNIPVVPEKNPLFKENFLEKF